MSIFAFVEKWLDLFLFNYSYIVLFILSFWIHFIFVFLFYSLQCYLVLKYLIIIIAWGWKWCYVHCQGMLAGHAYYFLEEVYPKMTDRRPLKTPWFLKALFADDPVVVAQVADVRFAAPPVNDWLDRRRGWWTHTLFLTSNKTRGREGERRFCLFCYFPK